MTQAFIQYPPIIPETVGHKSRAQDNTRTEPAPLYRSRRAGSIMDTSTIGTYLIHRGAEADLYASKFAEWNVVIKERVKKKYRDSGLDRQIRKERTVKEAS